jgi:hypothetical protein
MFCAQRLVFVGTEGVGSRFHVLQGRTNFRRYRESRVPFSAVSGESGPVFMFYAPRILFGGTGGVGSRFLILRVRISFRRYRGRWVPFSCFARLNSFSTVPRVSGPVFMFCTSGLIFGGTEGAESRSHVWRSRTPFRRYRGRRVPFSYFALPDLFSAVPRASDPVFIFCAPGLIFGDNVGVGSRFYFLRARNSFGRY